MFPNDRLLIRWDVGQAVTFDVLPDDILLAIFDFCVVSYQDLDIFFVIHGGDQSKSKIESWQSLVHVCRRWRSLIFESPRRLNLQLYCDPERSARKSLDVWPAFPLIIRGDIDETSIDIALAELEHNDRICQITLDLYTSSQVENLWTALQVPFPELLHLYLSFPGMSFVPVLPNSFLGGSAPHLQSFALNYIPFPGLQRLLLSATQLTYLYLINIPHSGYISPEAMATCLTALTNLERLQLQFDSPQSCPDQGYRRSPLPTPSVLPALTFFLFKGVYEYLEDLVARIDTPRLCQLSARFFNNIDFNTPELIRFVSRSSRFEALKGAKVSFGSQTASVELEPQASYTHFFRVTVLCRVPNVQLASLAQICTTSTPLLSTTENLFINEQFGSQLDWKDDIQYIGWLELLLPFTAVKNLYLSKQFAPRVAPVLQEMTVGGTTEVFPNLQNLYVEGFQPSESVEQGIERFISARQLADHPVAVLDWDRLGVGRVGKGR